MKILGIDSSATVASVAVCDGERLLAEFTVNNGNTHSETLLPMAEEALKVLSLTVKDIDLFAVSSGPGSFTGVRIGTATVKGLAFASGKPCVGVSTLKALAFNLLPARGLICPVMNARRSQVYTALFRSDGISLERLMPDSAMAISELDAILGEYGEHVYFCGDGYGITLDALKCVKAFGVPDRLRCQSGYSVAQTALKEYLAGNYSDDAALKVTYLRPSQAERELINKNKEKKEETK